MHLDPSSDPSPGIVQAPGGMFVSPPVQIAKVPGRNVFEMPLERFSRISLLDERPRFREGSVFRGLNALRVRCVRA